MSTQSLPRVTLRLLDPRLTGWGFPRWGSAAAAGLDLYACLDAPITLTPQGPPVLISAGFAMRIGDPAWCGLVFPRSGSGHHRGLVLGNGVGVIDADYEGPLLISAWDRNPASVDSAGLITIEPGDRIAQLVFTRIVRPDFVMTEAFEKAPAGQGRGASGFGSTGVR